MSHYLEWRDWSRDHFQDQNGLDSGLETSIDTKMSHSVQGILKINLNIETHCYYDQYGVGHKVKAGLITIAQKPFFKS